MFPRTFAVRITFIYMDSPAFQRLTRATCRRYVSLLCPSGSIHMESRFAGLPALSYLQPTGGPSKATSLQARAAWSLRRELAGVWAMTVLFLAFVMFETWGAVLDVKTELVTPKQV
jgi:hypothetical protein